MQKRGQVSLFIILGIVIVAIIGFIYFYQSSKLNISGNQENNQQLVNSQLEPIKNKIIGCIEKTSLSAVTTLGKQGGLFYPDKYETFGNYNVSYGCFKSGNQEVTQLPMLQDLNSQLQDYMQNTVAIKDIKNCINGFNEFKKQGLNINENGPLKISTNILNNKITLTINYPLEVKKGEVTAPINQMLTDLPIGLGKAHKIAVDIINAECNGQSYNYDILGEQSPTVTTSIQGYNNDKIIYLTTIPNSYREIPIEFNFIIQK